MEEEEYKATAFTVECRPQKTVFVCRVEEIHGNQIKPVEIKAKNIYIDGCGGVYAFITPEKVNLKATSLPEDDMKSLFQSHPVYFREAFAIDVTLDKGRLYAISTQAYPCE